jgi:hypothetical protein
VGEEATQDEGEGVKEDNGEDARWEGYEPRECGDHRTTGGRAWCFDCSEWCYDTIPCKGCELPLVRDLLASIWLYIDWRYVTKNLTTPQREMFANAVDEHGEHSTAERWWRDDFGGSAP